MAQARTRPRRTSSSQEHRIFAPGARVLCRDEEWIVRNARPVVTGGTAVRCVGVSELVRGRESMFLTALDDIIELKPEETQLIGDPSPGYRRTKLYLESLLRQTPPTDQRLYVGHRGAMNPANYQLVPAAKALAQPRPRILIADGVGLGKTIEVGILLSELIRRGRGRRILVVALKSVLEQFQEELWARFTIPLVRLDSVGIQRVQRKIPANMNPFYYFDRVIISIDTLKKDTKYQKFLRECHWDAIVIDECQHVAERSTAGKSGISQRARLAKLLSDTCDALVMTSATPHDGRPESFASLMNLLEPTSVADPSNYTAKEIDGLYVRRFKKDIAHEVKESFQERKLVPERIEASSAENSLFEALHEATFQTVSRGSQAKGALFRTLLLKSALSSPQALASTINERLKSKKLQEDEKGGLTPEAAHDRKTLLELRELAESVTPKKYAKLEKLLSLLESFGVGDENRDERVVIFSERIDTLDLLQEQIKKRFKLKGDAVATFHGSLDDQKQQRIVKEFGSENSSVRVLLASDAAAEGINLHYFCHRMVHFDIPWSLITLEQRNGRIDRYGQKHEPEIHYLLTVPGVEALRGDLRVLDRLIEKENEAHKNLGDVQWLLKLQDAEAEERHVVEGVSEGKAAEEIIPDLPEESEDDFFAMFEEASEQDEQIAAEQIERAQPLSLYPNDLDYVKDAFLELAEGELPVPEPKWHEHIQGVEIDPPEDLLRRFEYLPPELHRDANGAVKLTADRELVMRMLAESRQDADRWPEWHLLWDQHPVCEWLNDRLVAQVARHAAPVVRVHKGLEPNEACFVFEGIISNQRSQAVIVEWFVLPVTPSGEFGEARPLGDIIEIFGLADSLSNDGEPVEAADLLELRAKAVEAGRAHMTQVRSARAKNLLPELRKEQRRVRDWRNKRQDELETLANKPGTSSAKKKRIADELELVEQRVKAREDWIQLGVATDATPYLRLAAILVGTHYGRPVH